MKSNHFVLEIRVMSGTQILGWCEQYIKFDSFDEAMETAAHIEKIARERSEKR